MISNFSNIKCIQLCNYQVAQVEHGVNFEQWDKLFLLVVASLVSMKFQCFTSSAFSKQTEIYLSSQGTSEAFRLLSVVQMCVCQQTDSCDYI